MTRLCLFMIALYRRWLSPWLPPVCRYYPSCSVYAEEAVRRFGWGRGGLLAARRLLRCHPGHPGGFDPVVEPVVEGVGRGAAGRRKGVGFPREGR